VTLSTYEFLISYPDAANPNKIYLYDDQNNQVAALVNSCLAIYKKLCGPVRCEPVSKSF
jgi:hypothetical protein